MKIFIVFFLYVVVAFVTIYTVYACSLFGGFFVMDFQKVMSSPGCIFGKVTAIWPDTSSFNASWMTLKVFKWVGSVRSDSMITVWKYGRQTHFGAFELGADCSAIVDSSEIYYVPLWQDTTGKIIFGHYWEVLGRYQLNEINPEFNSPRSKVIRTVFENKKHAYGTNIQLVDSIYRPGYPFRVNVTISNLSDDTLWSPKNLWNAFYLVVKKDSQIVYVEFSRRGAKWNVSDTAGTKQFLPNESISENVELSQRFPFLQDTIVHSRATQLKIASVVNYAFQDLWGTSAVGMSNSSEILQISIDQTLSVSDVNHVQSAYHLYQNYPNPFNPSTTIQYELSERSNTSLRIFNVVGQEIATPVNEIQERGVQSATFDGANLPSGMYYYRLEAFRTTDPSKRFIQSKKFVLLK